MNLAYLSHFLTFIQFHVLNMNASCIIEAHEYLIPTVLSVSSSQTFGHPTHKHPLHLPEPRQHLFHLGTFTQPRRYWVLCHL